MAHILDAAGASCRRGACCAVSRSHRVHAVYHSTKAKRYAWHVQSYYERWRVTTRECIPVEQLELVPELARFVPPATVVDKTRYSAFTEPALHAHLSARRADGLIVTGSETDVCVLATVLSAVDRGYRVIVVENGVCSSSDAGHDALMTLYHQRFSEQIETASAEDVLARWEA